MECPRAGGQLVAVTWVPAVGLGLAPAGRAARNRLSVGAAHMSHPDGKERLVRRGLEPIADWFPHHSCSVLRVLGPVERLGIPAGPG